MHLPIIWAASNLLQNVFVNAHPLALPAGTITFPLKRVEQPCDHIHPQSSLQQRINRDRTRLLRISGAEIPTDDEVRRRIATRMTDMASRNQLLANNSLVLNSDNVITIQMGTPLRDFLVLVDSASADLWVGSENCINGCGTHNLLGPQSSQTFKDTRKPWVLDLGTSGTIVQDNVIVAGLSLMGHTFGTAQIVPFGFADEPYDGVMGLARSTLSAQRTPTLIEALAENGLVENAITSYRIGKDGVDGEITFGGLDTTKFDQHSLVTLPNLNVNGYWEGSLDTVTVNGQGTPLELRNRRAIFDTGTSGIIAPLLDAIAVHKSIGAAYDPINEVYLFPCDSSFTIALSFGATTFVLGPQDISIETGDGSGNCISGISSGPDLEPQWLMGNLFLSNAYLSTDVGKNTVSLAKLL